tara:strand:- start:2601 stop:2741 length:141 start_codon:yes stop_codon:yes gene_type:complete
MVKKPLQGKEKEEENLEKVKQKVKKRRVGLVPMKMILMVLKPLLLR